ncbi:MAG: YihY/virulence factor BrkB family protein, partial [Bacteroidota bacterium]
PKISPSKFKITIAFSFFLAIFPAIIFLFTLIPYVPIAGFQERLLSLLQSMLPYNTYDTAYKTIEEIIVRQNGGLLSFGFILALIVSTNGVFALIEGFNKTIMHEKRKGWKQRLVALYLTVLLATLLIIAILLIIITEVILHYFNNHILNLDQSSVYLLLAGKYLILILLCFTAISSLYFFGPSGGSKKWHFFSPGSILATILIAVTSIAFNFFILNFGQYNKIYGSIGTLIVILIYLNFNCIQLLIGFELNNAIEKAKFKPTVVEK